MEKLLEKGQSAANGCGKTWETSDVYYVNLLCIEVQGFTVGLFRLYITQKKLDYISYSQQAIGWLSPAILV